jgi:acyl-CoA synthetase (AMP-forming)/AMP-acid ligase II
MTFQSHETIVSIAQQRARLHPERDYIIFLEDGDERECRLTYDELDQSARRVAGWFHRQAVAPGERALVILPNGLTFNQVFFGCLYAGVLAVPLSEPAGPKQMASYLETFLPTLKASRPRVLITTPPLIAFIQHQLPSDLRPLFEGITLVSAEETLQGETDPTLSFQAQPTDIAYLQFTSGSTGTPKGIMISHRNIIANMEQARIFCQWEEEKGTALWLPLFHDFGLAAGMLGAMYSGGFVVLMTPAHFIVKPVRWLRAISRYRCAYSYAPPFAFDVCLRKVGPDEKRQLDLSSLISVTYGAEPVHYAAVKAFNDTFAECGLSATAIRPGFGMAETVIMFSKSPKLQWLCADREILETEGRLVLIDESAPADKKKYLVNLGTHMHGHEILIRNEQNQALPEGRVGEIMISGPSVCEGYFDDPAATEQIFNQKIEGRTRSFLATGDLGLLWENNLYFTGRIKDIVIIRGRNYYPQDIEYAVAQLEEIRAGCVIAFAAEDEAGEALMLAAEVRADLLKDLEVFRNYILPTIDRKIVELIGHQFGIYPAQRLYLEPRTIDKTSSGKIKHAANSRRLRQETIEGLLARLPDEPEGETDGATGLQKTVLRLFQKIVEQEPVLDEPFLELGGDSIKVLEFLETIQQQYPIPGRDLLDLVDETTTLGDIIGWLEGREGD